jgi:hypothetical protein
MHKWSRLMGAGLAALLLLTGCGADSSQQGNGHDHEHNGQVQQPTNDRQEYAPNGDLWETTASADELPSFLESLDPQIKEVYRIAGQHRELLTYIPCYCGCGDSAGHKHNGHCFIKEEKADGSIVWDDHATRCGVCLNIALISSQMADEGKSPLEIRTYIDERYKEGYATPTPTPMPQE